jgi:hypothetical protein
MLYFITKNPNLDMSWKALKWKVFVYFRSICYFNGMYIFWQIHGYIHMVVIWYIFPRFGILYQEKSDNLAPHFPGVFLKCSM